MKKGMMLIVMAAAGVLAGQVQPVSAQMEPGKATSPGQMRGPGEMHRGEAGERLKWLGEKLNLTEEQKGKMKPLLADEMQQLRALRDDASLAPEQKREKARATREATRDKIREILTPEQQKKLEEMKEKVRERRKERSEKPLK